MKTHDYIQLEEQYSAHNYHPLDVVIDRAEGGQFGVSPASAQEQRQAAGAAGSHAQGRTKGIGCVSASDWLER